MKRIFVLYLLFAFLPGLATAQEGPFVPCVGCESLTQTPYPETGLWYNPEQSPGTALNFEIQNGVLAGFFYGYDAEGRPEWELVSGQLQTSEEPGVIWELETSMVRATGGSCRDCAYTAPQITEGDTIRLEFMQRNYMRITVGGYDQYLVPFTYGSSAVAYFPNKTPYLFPVFVETTPFMVVIKPGSSIEEPGSWGSMIFDIETIGIIQIGNKRTLRYDLDNYVYWPPGNPVPDPPPPIDLGAIDCQLDDEVDGPVCKLAFDEPVAPGPFVIPVGNFSDSRFFGEAEDGSTIEGFRLDYD